MLHTVQEFKTLLMQLDILCMTKSGMVYCGRLLSEKSLDFSDTHERFSP